MRQISLKSQDVVIAIKLSLHRDKRWTYARLAEGLALTASQVFEGARRCELAGLIARQDDQLTARSRELTDFVLYGVRYAFPALLGEISRGMPTASGGPFLSTILVASAEGPPVWPFVAGQARGPTVAPLYPALPRAAQKDANLYNVLTLVDAVRIGGARDRELATDQLRKMLR